MVRSLILTLILLAEKVFRGGGEIRLVATEIEVQTQTRHCNVAKSVITYFCFQRKRTR